MNHHALIVLYAGVCLLTISGAQAASLSGQGVSRSLHRHLLSKKEKKFCPFLNGRFLDPKCAEELAGEGAMPPQSPTPTPPAPGGDETPSTPSPTDPNPTPPAPGEEELERCALDGAVQARSVAESACVDVVKICAPEPVPLKPTAGVKILQQSDVFQQILDRACRVKAIETCKKEAFDATEQVDGTCNGTLLEGPNELADKDLCESVIDANSIFTVKVNRLCEEAFPKKDGE